MLIGLGTRRIYCDIIGRASAPVVAMVHSLSADSTIWAEQVPALLAGGFRVLRIDLRGHGGSAMSVDDCTMSALADDFIRILNALNLRTIDFIGLSIGGMIGLDLLIRHADRISSAMLCDTAPSAVPGGIAMWQNRFDRVAAAGSCEAIADETMQRWFDGPLGRPDRWLQMRETIASTSPAGYVRCAKAIMEFDVRNELATISTPALVVCGANDIGTPAADNRFIAETIVGARYYEIAGARHMPNIQCPDIFNPIMIDWLGERQSKRSNR